MKGIKEIKTVSEYDEMFGQETLHPLVSIIDFSQAGVLMDQPLNLGFYSILFKTERVCPIKYGRNDYDYQAGTLLFIAPGQVMSFEEDGLEHRPKGYALVFHTDLLNGTSLGQQIRNYNFFSYDVHEALHLSEDEKRSVIENFKKIEYELKRPIDKHSKQLIVSNIELFLNYCVRFYDRQFLTRDYSGNGVIEKFDRLLNEYFTSEKLQSDGLPSVAYFANEFHLSANYFGDLIKKETGKTALEHIQGKLINLAKEKVFEAKQSVSAIAYELGFKYPQHFTRFFKKQVGFTPNEYRSIN
ncbi:MAG: AraC family transcriptional regulator [Pedobacter sp.]|nr:MAG: AraC family transcriptional regulator [Pedobacter sp.]